MYKRNLNKCVVALKVMTQHNIVGKIQGGSNMTGTDLCVRLHKSVPVIFEPPCTMFLDILLIPSSGILKTRKMPELLG